MMNFFPGRAVLQTFAPLVVFLMTGCGAVRSGRLPEVLVTSSLHSKPLTVWFDATANWERLSSREGVASLMDKCVDAGVDVVVIDVKPISGYVLYDSGLAPPMTAWKGHTRPTGYDLLRVACEEGHQRNLRVFAAMNFFAEGHLGVEGGVARHGTVFDFPERKDWESVDYVVPRGGGAPRLVPAEQGVRGHAVFVSAGNPEVVRYELALLREICTYPIDGVCLDRVRFSGITSDFSIWGRRSFEAWLGRTVEHWPEDIYTYRLSADDKPTSAAVPDAAERAPRNTSRRYDRVEGPLYRHWLVWRAQAIRDVIVKARKVVKDARPDCVFADYTGAWYPEYYNEGVNWASPRYNPSRHYAWAPATYQETGYADLLDRLYSGWYYTYVTEKEAEAAGVSPWASIEGAARLIDQVVGTDCPVDAGLYLFQYKDNPALFRQCMRRGYDLSDGLMLFDLVYLEEYGWWDDIKATFPERLK